MLVLPVMPFTPDVQPDISSLTSELATAAPEELFGLADCLRRTFPTVVLIGEKQPGLEMNEVKTVGWNCGDVRR